MSKLRWFDCNGCELKEGDTVKDIYTGRLDKVYACHPADYPEETSLGLNASNEEFLELHPEWPREVYPFSAFEHKLVDGQRWLTEYEKVG